MVSVVPPRGHRSRLQLRKKRKRIVKKKKRKENKLADALGWVAGEAKAPPPKKEKINEKLPGGEKDEKGNYPPGGQTAQLLIPF